MRRASSAAGPARTPSTASATTSSGTSSRTTEPVRRGQDPALAARRRASCRCPSRASTASRVEGSGAAPRSSRSSSASIRAARAGGRDAHGRADPRRGAQAVRDRLAVEEVRVPVRGLQAVPDGVPQVQRDPPGHAGGLALVGEHGLDLRPRRALDDLGRGAALPRGAVAARPAPRRRPRASRTAARRPGPPSSRTRPARPGAGAAGATAARPRRGRWSTAGGTRRPGSCPPAGRRRSCRRSPSPPGRPASSGTLIQGTPRR